MWRSWKVGSHKNKSDSEALRESELGNLDCISCQLFAGGLRDAQELLVLDKKPAFYKVINFSLVPHNFGKNSFVPIKVLHSRRLF